MSNDQRALTPADFPPAVHESLKDLRAIAKRATSKDDPELRRATEDEVALALMLRKPFHCKGKSSRTGLPCVAPRILGAEVCHVHGGALKKTRIAAANRLREATMPVLNSLIKTALQEGNLNAQVKAADSVLNRAGIGEDIQAKIRSSKKQDGGNRIQVSIGFLSPNPIQPTIIIPGNHDDPEA